jgi:hypothetical protein
MGIAIQYLVNASKEGLGVLVSACGNKSLVLEPSGKYDSRADAFPIVRFPTPTAREFPEGTLYQRSLSRGERLPGPSNLLQSRRKPPDAPFFRKNSVEPVGVCFGDVIVLF